MTTPPDEAALDAVVAGADPDAERWVIELIALPDPCPAAVRMKVALKGLLRRHSLKCVAVSSPPAESRNGSQ